MNRQSTARAPEDAPVVSMRGISKTYRQRRRKNTVLQDLDLDILPGETLALVGESGSGKTTLSRIVVGLTDPDAGRILTDGRDLTRHRRQASAERALLVQMVFQDPYASMNPRMRIRDVIAEPLHTHRRTSLGTAGIRRRVGELLESVDLEPAIGERYPHECSGGQRQRIAIARALALEPRLLVLDEPTSALDVSVQAKILDLLAELQERTGVALLFVTHDLAVVSGIADRIAVMAAGRLEEVGPCREVLAAPSSEVTRRLLDSVAHPDPRRANPKLLTRSGAASGPTDDARRAAAPVPGPADGDGDGDGDGGSA
ncbi:ABC transporter ATP-binding protein [Brachybacterium subflavum]|uniref:ABC transporter ATP-binding protein n=1 Tax=Brachybacterium subflavum TaxID=2585206 RepID=UPI0012660E29|nr:dipeptide/oligopeptide/nickel ABC transporter ATP-binding protein [Brachybacterium subflavum]